MFPRIRTKGFYRRFAKAMGLNGKRSKRYAKKMYNKQYDKYLPHGLVRKYAKSF